MNQHNIIEIMLYVYEKSEKNKDLTIQEIMNELMIRLSSIMNN